MQRATVHTEQVVPPNLETLAMRAVEVTVLGRQDHRLLVATKRRLTRPKRIARLLAGLANAAGDRHALLLLGVRGHDVTGLDSLPDADWWDELEEAFPGTVPDWEWSVVDIDGADVLVIGLDPSTELIPAFRRDSVIVPFFDRGGIRRTPPADDRRVSTSQSMATAKVVSGWVQRVPGDHSGSIAAFRGRLSVEIASESGRIADTDCSATLLGAEHVGPVGLDVQVHPAEHRLGVFRHDRGVEIRNDVQVEVLLAAATRTPHPPSEPHAVQLVVSLALPGRGVPELRSLLLNPDPRTPGRWTL